MYGTKRTTSLFLNAVELEILNLFNFKECIIKTSFEKNLNIEMCTTIKFTDKIIFLEIISFLTIHLFYEYIFWCMAENFYMCEAIHTFTFV